MSKYVKENIRRAVTVQFQNGIGYLGAQGEPQEQGPLGLSLQDKQTSVHLALKQLEKAGEVQRLSMDDEKAVASALKKNCSDWSCKTAGGFHVIGNPIGLSVKTPEGKFGMIQYQEAAGLVF